MIRAVIDTNVVVSGMLFGGLPYKIVRAAIARKFTLVTSPTLIEEIERVVGYPKFSLSNAEVNSLTAPLFSLAEMYCNRGAGGLTRVSGSDLAKDRCRVRAGT